MRPRGSIPIVFLAAVIIAALGTAWQQRYVRRGLESSLAALARKRNAHDVTHLNPSARLHVANQDGDGPETAPARPPPTKVDSPKTPTTHPVDVLHDDPDVQVLWLASRRALVAATYGPLFRSLALTPAQIEAFQAIVIRREEQALDQAAIMRTKGLVFTDPALMTLRQKADDDERTARLALLGPEGFRQLQEYLRTLPVREWSDALAGVAAVSGTPLSAEQTARLTQMLANTSSHYVAGGVADMGSIAWETADRQARTLLSAEQFALYETIEPEGRSGRFGSRVTHALERARKAEAATAPGR